MSDDSRNFEVCDTWVVTEFGEAILSDGQRRTLEAVTSAGPRDEIVVTGVDGKAGTITMEGYMRSMKAAFSEVAMEAAIKKPARGPFAPPKRRKRKAKR